MKYTEGLFYVMMAINFWNPIFCIFAEGMFLCDVSRAGAEWTLCESKVGGRSA